jgi:hypothetical protein
LVIESLRQMSEVLIWGDQNNVPQIFEYVTTPSHHPIVCTLSVALVLE